MNIWQWQDKTQVIADFPNGAQLRLTIGACSGYENGLYSAYMQEARNYIKDIHDTSAPNVDMTPEESRKALNTFVSKWLADATPEQLAEWSRYHQRAIILACLLKAESRESEADEWRSDELPLEWRSIVTFDRAIPALLYDRWLTAAIELNPGQFIALDGDDLKKNVRVTETKLLN